MNQGDLETSLFRINFIKYVSNLTFFEQVDPLILINALITGRLHILSKLRSLIFLLELNKLVRSKAQTIKTTRFGKGERHRTLGVT